MQSSLYINEVTKTRRKKNLCASIALSEDMLASQSRSKSLEKLFEQHALQYGAAHYESLQLATDLSRG